MTPSIEGITDGGDRLLPPKHRCALVTGSLGGLGHAIAVALARSGFDIVLTDVDASDTGPTRCAKLARAHGVDARYVRADLSSHDGTATLFERLRGFDRLPDVLVNNAVVRHFGPLESFPLDAWDRALAVNVSAAFALVRLVLPHMRSRGWGRVVNMTSVYACRGVADRVDYVTTKSALLGLTRAIAMETIDDGITCNAVAPGSVLTDSIDARVERLAETEHLSRTDAERKFLAGKQPTGRFVEAEHVGDLVAFLCGPSASAITGALIPMDGGWLAS